jgi:hypothetical protein
MTHLAQLRILAPAAVPGKVHKGGGAGGAAGVADV